jgi:hypothetical protein
MANTKLMKVMEYLINEQEDKARDLLHQIFIEKARAIHEEMMQEEDDDLDEELLKGDKTRDFVTDLEADEEMIKNEQHFSPMEGEDMDADDADMDDAVEDLGDELEDMDADDADMGDEEVEVDMDDEDMTMDDDAEDMTMDMGGEDHADGSEEDRIEDLEAAIEALKAEFEALKHEGDEHEGDEHEGAEHEGDEHAEEEEDVAEAWETMDEEFDHLDENIDLDTVTTAKGGEVGSGKFARAEGNTRSPVANTRSDMGAKAVVTGKGAKASGYERQAAPTSASMGANNRLKKSTQGMSPVSKEGSTKALLNKDRSEGFGAPNTTSPIRGK